MSYHLEQPPDLSEQGVKAHRILVQYLKLQDMAPDKPGTAPAFYSPAQWAARGEEYGKKSHLIVVYDGGSHRPAFTMDEGCYETVEAMQQQLASVGLFFEECTCWYGAVHCL